MAAAVQSSLRCLIANDADIVVATRLSAMTSDQIETLSFATSRAPKRLPRSVRMRVITPPTARCVMNFSCDESAGSATSQTVPVRVYTEAGGDISGAVVEFELSFDGVAAT